MLIPRKEKGQRETYRCKLGIHTWVTEHWWELRQRPGFRGFKENLKSNS